MGGAVVKKSKKYAEIRSEYIELFENAEINPKDKSTAMWSHSRIVDGKSRYELLEQQSGVPWYVIGILHGMECGFDFERHLFNGDPLSDYTKRYPPGYPKDRGSPPFSFDESALSALTHDKLTEVDDWSLPHMLYKFERYNGTRTRTEQGFATPYLWSFTNNYVSGKYIEIKQPDGSYESVFDKDLVSKQCGVAASLLLLKQHGLIELK